MAGEASKKVVVAAVLANVAIAVTKFIVAAISGSSVLLAEAIHSTVDVGNGFLLYLGMRAAARPADPEHPFGHGKDLYFFSLVVAMLIFGLGGGMSFYEGIKHLGSPKTLGPSWPGFVVLGAAGLFEGLSLRIAWREFALYRRRRLRSLPVLLSIHLAKDPSMFSVLLEDSVAIAGVLIAALGLALAQLLHAPICDALASCAIGLLLAAVALLLAFESRGLLIGERALPWVVKGVRELAAGDPAVAEVRSAQTMQIGPDEVLLTLNLRFRPELAAEEITRASTRISAAIRQRFHEVKHVLLDVESLAAQ